MRREEAPQNRHVLIRDSSPDSKKRLQALLSKYADKNAVSRVEVSANKEDAVQLLNAARLSSNDFSVLIFYTSNKPQLPAVKELAYVLTEHSQLQVILVVEKVCD